MRTGTTVGGGAATTGTAAPRPAARGHEPSEGGRAHRPVHRIAVRGRGPSCRGGGSAHLDGAREGEGFPGGEGGRRYDGRAPAPTRVDRAINPGGPYTASPRAASDSEPTHPVVIRLSVIMSRPTGRARRPPRGRPGPSRFSPRTVAAVSLDRTTAGGSPWRPGDGWPGSSPGGGSVLDTTLISAGSPRVAADRTDTRRARTRASPGRGLPASSTWSNGWRTRRRKSSTRAVPAAAREGLTSACAGRPYPTREKGHRPCETRAGSRGGGGLP